MKDKVSALQIIAYHSRAVSDFRRNGLQVLVLKIDVHYFYGKNPPTLELKHGQIVKNEYARLGDLNVLLGHSRILTMRLSIFG